MELLILLSILLLLPALAFGQQCSLPGECLGKNLETEFHDTERHCLEYCKTVEGCEWYTYDSSSGYCSVLADCPQKNLDCTTCVHGENACEIRLCFVPGECSGSLLGHVVVPTKEECLAACHSEQECHYFTFYEERGVCNLFETCVVVESPNVDAVSGERGCYQGGQQAFTNILFQYYESADWMHMPSLFESGDGSTCGQIADYPLTVGSAVGELVDGAITVCGGGGSSTRAECFSLVASLNVWVELPSMPDVRYDAVSVVTPAGWWVTGYHLCCAGRCNDLVAISEDNR